MRLRDIVSEMATKQEPIVTVYEQTCIYAQMHPEEYPWISDIDKFRLHRRTAEPSQFVIFSGPKAVAYFELVEQTLSQALLKNIYVAAAARGNKLTEKFMWFARSNLGYTRIILDWRHSKLTRFLIPSVANTFRVSWINTETNEVKPYDPDTSDEFYWAPTNEPEDKANRENWTVMFEGSSGPMPIKETTYKPGDMMPEWDQIYECYFPRGMNLDGIPDDPDTPI